MWELMKQNSSYVASQTLANYYFFLYNLFLDYLGTKAARTTPDSERDAEKSSFCLALQKT